MNIKKILAVPSFFLISLIANPLHAAVTCSATQCTGPIKEVIGGVFPTDTGDIILPAPTIVSNLSCTGINGFNTILLSQNHGRFEETYALILYAAATNENVTVRLTSDSLNNGTTCEVSYIRANF